MGQVDRWKTAWKLRHTTRNNTETYIPSFTAGKCVHVIDGDTLVVVAIDQRNGSTNNWKIRLARIDTPELSSTDPVLKAAAYKAKAFVEKLCHNKIIHVNIKSYEKYGRLLADISIPDPKQFRIPFLVPIKYIDLADHLLFLGLAQLYNGKGTKFSLEPDIQPIIQASPSIAPASKVDVDNLTPLATHNSLPPRTQALSCKSTIQSRPLNGKASTNENLKAKQQRRQVPLVSKDGIIRRADQPPPGYRGAKPRIRAKANSQVPVKLKYVPKNTIYIKVTRVFNQILPLSNLLKRQGILFKKKYNYNKLIKFPFQALAAIIVFTIPSESLKTVSTKKIISNSNQHMLSKILFNYFKDMNLNKSKIVNYFYTNKSVVKIPFRISVKFPKKKITSLTDNQKSKQIISKTRMKKEKKYHIINSINSKTASRKVINNILSIESGKCNIRRKKSNFERSPVKRVTSKLSVNFKKEIVSSSNKQRTKINLAKIACI